MITCQSGSKIMWLFRPLTNWMNTPYSLGKFEGQTVAQFKKPLPALASQPNFPPLKPLFFKGDRL